MYKRQQLAWEGGCYYLIAYQDKKDPANIRNYRVDRMSYVKVLDHPRRGKEAFAAFDPVSYTHLALAAQVEALATKPEGFAVLDPAVEEPMKAAIRAAGADGDSVGGLLETAILGLPAGIGEPYFDLSLIHI